MKAKSLLFAFLLSATLLFPSCSGPYSDAGVPGGSFPEIGSLAPNFTLARFNNEGDPIELKKAVEGKKIVLINFWATWCGPCLYELPMLERMYKKLRHDGFTVLAINVDSDRDAAQRYLEESSYTFPTLIDVGHRVKSRYGVYALPTNVMLDGQGRVVHFLKGFSPMLEPQIERMLLASE